MKPAEPGSPGQSPPGLSGHRVSTVQAALDTAGSAVAAWTRVQNGRAFVESAVRPRDGRWRAPVVVDSWGPASAVLAPALAVDAQGDAELLWVIGGAHAHLLAASRRHDRPWTRPVTLVARPKVGQRDLEPSVALAPSGELVAVWLRTQGHSTVVQGASGSIGGPWSAPGRLTTAGHNGVTPQVALGADGTATAIWDRPDRLGEVVQAAGAAAERPRATECCGQRGASPGLRQ